MKKGVKRTFLGLFCLAVLLLICLSSCSEDVSEGKFGDFYEALSEYYADEMTEADDKDEEQKNTFVVIIPVGCGAEIFDSAVFLCNTLSHSLGYEVELFYDSDYVWQEGVTEILVGNTNRYKSRNYLKTLRAFDSGYKYSTDTLLIAAHTESLCAEAVTAFAKGIEGGEINPDSLEGLEVKVSVGEYPFERVKLCGFELCEYEIVYPAENSEEEKVLAAMLRKMIIERFGYYLNVVSDAECADSTRGICVGITSISSFSKPEIDSLADSRTSICFGYKRHIELLARDNSGIYLAIDNFVSLLEDSKNADECLLELGDELSYEYDNDGICLYISRGDTAPSTVEAYSVILREMRSSDLALFNTVTADALQYLRYSIGQIDAIENDAYYRVDGKRFNIVSAQSDKVLDGAVVSLVLENISDGKRFAVVNAFSRTGGAAQYSDELLARLLEECKKYSGIPMIVTHELDESLDARLFASLKGFARVDGASGIYFTENCFALTSVRESVAEGGSSADVVKIKYYYTADS